jgi:tetratricopeptide (TPR) repeat protein
LPDHIRARSMGRVTSDEDKLPLHSVRLREHRLESDYSYEEAAARLRQLSREADDETEAGTTAQRVWSWEHGAYPQARHRRLLCRLYGATAEELGFRSADESAKTSAKRVVAHREWLPTEEYAGIAKDVESDGWGVSREMAAMAAFRAADGQVGGGHMYATVATFLRTEIAPRVFQIDPAHDGAQLFNAAAALTEMAGWMAFDAGRNDLARRCFDRAQALVRAGDDRQLMAHVLASMSHMAHSLDEPRRAINLAREAQVAVRSGPRNVRLDALLLAREARGFAANGDSRECARLLVRAEALVCSAPDTTPSPWISPFDEASFAGEAATCLYQLGDLAQARSEAERVLALRDGSRARSRAFAQLIVAGVLANQGALDEACTVGTKVLDGTAALGSSRVLQQFDGLRRALDGHRSTPAVAEFLVRLDVAIRERGWLRAWDQGTGVKEPL